MLEAICKIGAAFWLLVAGVSQLSMLCAEPVFSFFFTLSLIPRFFTAVCLTFLLFSADFLQFGPSGAAAEPWSFMRLPPVPTSTSDSWVLMRLDVASALHSLCEGSLEISAIILAKISAGLFTGVLDVSFI